MRREVTLIYRHSFVYLFRLLQVGTLVSPFCNQSALSWRTAACIVYIRVLKIWVGSKNPEHLECPLACCHGHQYPGNGARPALLQVCSLVYVGAVPGLCATSAFVHACMHAAGGGGVCFGDRVRARAEPHRLRGGRPHLPELPVLLHLLHECQRLERALHHCAPPSPPLPNPPINPVSSCLKPSRVPQGPHLPGKGHYSTQLQHWRRVGVVWSTDAHIS